MSWFDDQIRERKRREDENFAEALDEIASLLGREKAGAPCESESARQRSTVRAVEEILDYFHIKSTETPDRTESVQAIAEALCRPHGVMCRRVRLEGDWYRDAAGAYLGVRKDGTAVALLPSRLSGYGYYDRASGRRVKITAHNAGELEAEALCLYRPLPLRPLTFADLMHYAVTSVPAASYFMLFAALLAMTLAGTLLPYIIRMLIRDVVPGGSVRQLAAIAVFFACSGLGALMMSTARTMMDGRIRAQMETSVRAAVMARLLSLSPKFFKRSGAGELAERVRHVSDLCGRLHSRVMVTGLSAAFSLLYLLQVQAFAPALLTPCVCMLLSGVLLALLSARLNTPALGRALDAADRTNGMTYALISGIRKIRLAGAEKRAFTRYAGTYAQEVKYSGGVSAAAQLAGAAAVAIPAFGSVVLYARAAGSGVAPADYFAFTAAFGVVLSAYAALIHTILKASDIPPAIAQIQPILQARPEVEEERKIVRSLKGGIEVSNVSFRYEENMPWVLDNLSLKIRPGQYVAIVGRTGCGKSTLMRLLLGFETPLKGAIYYDRQDMSTLDLRSLRSRIGVVMQNGRLLQEDIFSNIAIAAPDLSMDEAWEAAELAGIAEDIRAMPMGMHTVISAGGGGISGGQSQRLLIARAVAPKPKILMFDEATSALDNITQKKISDALGKLRCTRIVIAHRLSTIRQCDRILVLHNGRIEEDGTYDELIAKNGIFAELVERQKMEE